MYMEDKASSSGNEKSGSIIQNDVATFPFWKLAGLNSLNFVELSTVAEHLKQFLTIPEFYNNHNNPPHHVLRFVMANCIFFVETVDSGPYLISFLGLLRELIVGMNTFTTPLGFAHDKIGNIIALLIKVMNSGYENHVKLEAGKIVRELIEMACLDIEASDISYLSVKAIDIFEAEQCLAELLRLFYTLLKRRQELEIDPTPFLSWIETDCVLLASKENEPQVLLPMLECWLLCYESYYKNQERPDRLTINLKQLLPQICTLMSDSLLRPSTEQLLSSLIKQLYLVNLLNNDPGDKAAILKEIQALPDNYQDWFNTNGKMFFIIVYTQLHHSRLLWSPTDILESICGYFSVCSFPSCAILEALIMIYPMVIYTNSNLLTDLRNRIVIQNISVYLLMFLSASQSLPKLLTYHPVQMEWLLANADAPLRNRLMVCWLYNCRDDHQILPILETTKKGYLLLRFLVNYPDAPISSRLSQLITQLTIEPKLQKEIEIALPRLCSRPRILSQMLQLQPTIPSDPMRIFSLLKIISASLPFLEDDVNIRTACSYSCRLLNVVKNEANAVILFSHLNTSIRFLVAKSACKEDQVALTTIKLLKQLVSIQISNRVENLTLTNINLLQLLQGNSQRISIALSLFRLLLLNADQPLFLTYPKETTLDLYHYVHTLLNQDELAAPALKVLKGMIRREKNLAFSLATPSSLRVAFCIKLKAETVRQFLEFVAIWLCNLSAFWYADVPVAQLRCFLNSVPHNREYGKYIDSILGRLNNFQKYQYQG